MPVTKTAKRALKGSKTKFKINQKVRINLEIAVRRAKKSGTASDVQKATSAVDRAAKKGLIHKNKAARIKSKLSKTAKTKSSKKSR